MNLSPLTDKQFLKTIVEKKRIEVDAAKRRTPLNTLRQRAESARLPKKFSKIFSQEFACIAEIKKASPSKGLLTQDFQPERIAREYERGGASAISVLTDGEFFGGSIEDMRKVREASSLPVLRKEFIIDEYQIYEARVHGADAVLLISEILSESELRGFISLAKELSLDSIVEGHTAEEITKARRAGAEIIGVNNRDLNTFSLDPETSARLRSLIPEGVIAVSESGIRTSDELRRLVDLGYHGALIGETLMVLQDREEGLRHLFAPLRKG